MALVLEVKPRRDSRLREEVSIFKKKKERKGIIYEKGKRETTEELSLEEEGGGRGASMHCPVVGT
jgi:hypothetical protein